MKFKDFYILNESGHRDELSLEDCIELYHAHCRGVDRSIYRGVKGDYGKYSIVEGQKGKRESVDTSNHYTVILDELISKESNNYPLRSGSIICSTSAEYAKRFGAVYEVIPYADNWVGVVGSQDIWELNLIREVSMKVFNDNYVRADIDADSIKQIADDIDDLSDEEFKKHFGVILSRGVDKSTEEQIRGYYSLENLGMKFAKATDLSDKSKYRNGEMWIGGKCIMIRADLVEQFYDVANGVEKGELSVYQTDSLYPQRYADVYAESKVDSDDEATTVSLDGLNLLKLKYKMEQKISVEDFFDEITKHVNPDDKDDYESELEDLLEHYKEEDFLHNILKYNGFGYITDYIKPDGFTVVNLNDVSIYIIFK